MSKDINTKKLSIGVGDHKEIADSEDVPSLDSWYHSFDQEGNISKNIQYYPLTSLSKWRKTCKNTNVYRTLKLFDHETREVIFLGTFPIDIDNGDDGLEDALAVTKQAVTVSGKRFKAIFRRRAYLFHWSQGF